MNGAFVSFMLRHLECVGGGACTRVCAFIGSPGSGRLAKTVSGGAGPGRDV